MLMRTSNCDDDSDPNFTATELRLGLPGTHGSDKDTDKEKEKAADPNVVIRSNKRASPETAGSARSLVDSCSSTVESGDHDDASPPAKSLIVGWPPVQSYRRKYFHAKKPEAAEGTGMYVKVSMDGAPYLRKIDLTVYKCYPELLKGLENMFKLTIGASSEMEGYHGYAPTYEDSDGDWMLVGDVPWEMFISSCKRLRIMKESEVQGSGNQ